MTVTYEFEDQVMHSSGVGYSHTEIGTSTFESDELAVKFFDTHQIHIFWKAPRVSKKVAEFRKIRKELFQWNYVLTSVMEIRSRANAGDSEAKGLMKRINGRHGALVIYDDIDPKIGILMRGTVLDDLYTAWQNKCPVAMGL